MMTALFAKRAHRPWLFALSAEALSIGLAVLVK